MGHEERAAEASRRMWQAGSASVGVTPNRVLGEGAGHFLEPNHSINRRMGKVGKDLGILFLPAADYQHKMSSGLSSIFGGFMSHNALSVHFIVFFVCFNLTNLLLTYYGF